MNYRKTGTTGKLSKKGYVPPTAIMKIYDFIQKTNSTKAQQINFLNQTCLTASETHPAF